MPDIKFQHIVSFSSEDKNHPAENLLKSGGSHKWKGAAAGEKQLSAVIQLEKACQIYSLDIGNEGSAFVEVLVGRSSAAGDDNFEVLLVTSSFMSPMESRNGTNRNSVRIFCGDKISKNTASQKWDRVKVVCTQPFNKTSTYGLSFITLHSPPEPGEKANKEQDTKLLGAFRLKAESEDKGSLRVGTLFAKYEQQKTDPLPLKGAAAIRAASKLAEEAHDSKQPTPAKKVQTTPSPAQKRKLSGDDDTTPSPIPPLRKQSTSMSSSSSSGSRKVDTPRPPKKTKSEPVKPSPSREFGKVMEGVVFVLSGYTNPRRGEVRDRALKMGAQYRSDWGRGCTHLVCAFANTPKYSAVQGKGKIVTHHWINDCFKTKKLLSWKDYRCGDAETPSESSGEEEEITPRQETKPATKSPSEKNGSKTETKKRPKLENKQDADDSDTDLDDSGEDTEDELRKLKEKQNTPAKGDKPGKMEVEDLYGDSTDDDQPKTPAKTPTKPATTSHDDSDSGLPELPDFFTDKNFMLFGDFPAAERRLLVRYITAFNGQLSDYMNDNVHYVVTKAQWDDTFDEALSDVPTLVFVKPKWIFACNEKNKLVPYQPYVVVPQ